MQIVASRLGVELDQVVVHQGQTDGTPFGMGTGGSRSAPILAAAIHNAADEMRAKVVDIASHLLEASPADIELQRGRAEVVGTPTRFVTMADLAWAAYMQTERLPDGMAPGLDVTHRFDSPTTVYSNACHACTVEVDPELGDVRILRYVVSEDCGVMINPRIVEGQIAGGVAQGIAGTLYEEFVYDDHGTPLTTSFVDYGVPSAVEIPPIEYAHVETPGPNPGGHKGAGEGGAIGAPACVFNAVADALRPLGVQPSRTPLSPAVVRALVEQARGS
jgi:aerobic carbon-monoxide dehydrogenase large subunit